MSLIWSCNRACRITEGFNKATWSARPTFLSNIEYTDVVEVLENVFYLCMYVATQLQLYVQAKCAVYNAGWRVIAILAIPTLAATHQNSLIQQSYQ